MSTWGSIYNAALARGEDHGSAAYRADQWEARQKRSTTMDNQHRKIKGYRELSQDEINAMNEIKEKGKELGDLVDKLRALDVDQRWISIGATDLQQGLMALTRGVAKPEFF